jgi:hypothetical protein
MADNSNDDRWSWIFAVTMTVAGGLAAFTTAIAAIVAAGY